jgi:hypothetical protein
MHSPRMNRSRAIAGVLVLGCALVAGACAQREPFSADQKTALRQLERLVPVGTPEAHAKRLLGDRGFKFSQLESASAANSNYLLVATCSVEGRIWQVGVVVVDRKVAATSTTISMLDARRR